MPVQVGQQAPDFKLFDSDKQEVNLSSFRGQNVVLLFFPLAFTGTCTKELCETRDSISFYNDMDAQVFGISIDSLFVLDVYKKEQNLNFPLLSDFNKDASIAYDVLYDTFPAFGMKGVAQRSSFVIDKEGIIRFAEVLPKPGDYPNFDGIKSTLNSLNLTLNSLN